MSQRLRSAFAVVVCLLFATVASAQTPTQPLKDGEYTVQRFAPAPGPRNLITVEGARTDGQMAFSLGIVGNYGNDPFVINIKPCTPTATCDRRDLEIVQTMLTADLLASLTVVPRVQIGLRLPYTYVKGAGLTTDPNDNAYGQQLRGGLEGSGLGDPMVEAKIRAFGSPGDDTVIGFALFGTAPVADAVSGTKDKMIGDSSATFGVRGIYDGQWGRFGAALNVAGVYRGEALVGPTHLGSELRYGVGASYEVSPILNVMAEGFGSTKFSSEAGTNALEADFAGQLRPLSSRLAILAGAGVGIVQAVGVPSVRAFAGASFTFEKSDEDGDGISDDKDQCPAAAEDMDGFQDADGCPDPDNDGDGILDANDKCPSEPETKNDYQDADGCPDEVPDRDNDGVADTEDKCPDEGGPTVIRRKGEFYGCPDRDKDGVPDKIDKCPDEPEDTDGYQDADGCPDPDNDGDGILDVDDQCVDVPEVMNGYQDADGCPDEVPDRDHDGIKDSDDKCPDAPETYNGYLDDDGCPDRAPLAELTDDGIVIKDIVNFAKDSDKIIGPQSFKVLDGVASLMVHHPEIFQVEVGGHTDDAGDAAHNTELSKARAAAVVAYLTTKKVDAKRLSSQGYGPDKPIADNKTTAGRAKNRRVEFHIVSSTKKPPAAPK
jgi:outer membrane protein OmpA-like peptidoglycan-associated protein